MKSQTLILFIGMFVNTSLNAAAEHVVGLYSLSDLHSISMNCQEREIKSITFTSTNSAGGDCTGHVQLESVALSYKSGLNQYFVYPSDGGSRGTRLTQATVHVLPGTRCLSGLALATALDNEHSDGCRDRHRVQVSVNY